MSEHKLGLSGIIDESSAAELGKIIGAAVLVFGRIQGDKYDETTSKADSWKDKNGNWHQTHYRTGTYDMSVNLKVIDIKTAKILAARSLSSSKTSKNSADNKWPEGIDKDLLYTKCLKSITSQFMKIVSPYDVQIKASFQTDKLLPEVDQALTQLKIGEWDEGIKLFEDATKKNKILSPKFRLKHFMILDWLKCMVVIMMHL